MFKNFKKNKECKKFKSFFTEFKKDFKKIRVQLFCLQEFHKVILKFLFDVFYC